MEIVYHMYLRTTLSGTQDFPLRTSHGLYGGLPTKAARLKL